MKQQLFIASLCLIGSFVLCACEKEKQANSNSDETSELWLDANSLASLELRGQVRSVNQQLDEDNSVYMEFDVMGNLILVSDQTEFGREEIVYTYNDDNQLVSETTNDEVVRYEYSHSEKYVPQNPRHWSESRLVKSLASISSTYGESWHFIEEENLLYAVSETDTVTIQYEGMFPVSCEYVLEGIRYFIGPITYYKNGMFKEYVEGFYSQEGGRVNTTEMTFIANQDWQLVQSSKTDEGTAESTYNKFHHLETMTIQGALPIVSNYHYEYDAKGNWTKSTMMLQYANYPEVTTETTRQITYY